MKEDPGQDEIMALFSGLISRMNRAMELQVRIIIQLEERIRELERKSD